MDDEARFIIQSNIKHFSEILRGTLDVSTRKTVEDLLATAKLQLSQDTRALC